MEAQKGEVILYQREDSAVQIDVRVEGETVWLTQELKIFRVNSPLYGRSCFRNRCK
ncbi:hypothetical protein HMPREF9075_00969 [Capnocytophaga sp. oral taxon 332 str. F0381]|uniref:hypothetical protein n=1 Tax=Capnocytophaga sp. oral taxon 332 TaxID=712213 RepID=UPI0002A3C9CE|nr:hypothetical protein [Capnocytophaga sp. oral taxon 332]EKY10733.1 hypothetical protein HMPREF9075_00969 [Capnocytophaga sp. oral taxon 332 str. F0381]